MTTSLWFKNHTDVFPYSSESQKSDMGLTGLVPPGGSRGEATSLPISASGGQHHSLARDPFLKSLQTLASSVLSPTSSDLLPPCDDIRLPQTIQNNLPISRFLTQLHQQKSLSPCRVTLRGSRDADMNILGGCYSACHTQEYLECVPAIKEGCCEAK